MGTRFRAMLAPIGVSTGDGRRFAPGSITAAPTPFPFEWARERDTGHDGAVTIGAVHSVEITNDAVWAEGEFFDDVDREEMPRLAEDVAEAMKLISEGVLGPSVDLDEFEGIPVREGTDQEITREDLEEADENGEELKIELLITEGRVRAATLVSIPAYVETVRPLELIEPEDAEMASGVLALTAAVIGSTSLPIASTDREWDGQAALDRVFEAHTNEDGEVNVSAVSRAFLWRDPDADPQTKGAYSLGFADMIDGELTIVPRGVAATAGGRGVDAADIPEADKARIRSRICALYDRIQAENEDWPDCPFTRDSEARAALVASVTLPDTAAFDRPELDGPTPVTVDWETGRIFGHIATWGTCHAGFPDVCITAPKNSRPDGEYAWFHRFPVDTSGGTVWAGRMTAGGRHPGLNLTASATMAAYDGKTVAAYVRAGEDDHGIWISGVVNPDLDERTKRILSRRKVSGDWRETSDGLSLVELLALSPGPRLYSEPGFPVATRSQGGRQVALTAALGPSAEDEPRRELFARIGQEVAAQLRAEREAEKVRQARRAELAAALEADRTNRAAPVRAELAEMLEG